jgi:ABC-type multidrug transport system ATPase subunit
MMCNRVAILVGGQVARQGRIEELNAAKQRYEIEIVGIPTDSDLLRKSLAGLFTAAAASTPTVTQGLLSDGVAIEIIGNIARIGTMDPAPIQKIVDTLRASNIILRRVQPVKPSLEDLYLDAVIDPATGRAAGAGAALQTRAFPVNVASKN